MLGLDGLPASIELDSSPQPSERFNLQQLLVAKCKHQCGQVGTFHLISPINGRTHLRLFDITGRMVWSKIVEDSEAYFTTTNVPSGCYFLDVRDSKNGVLAIKRLIIH